MRQEKSSRREGEKPELKRAANCEGEDSLRVHQNKRGPRISRESRRTRTGKEWGRIARTKSRRKMTRSAYSNEDEDGAVAAVGDDDSNRCGSRRQCRSDYNQQQRYSHHGQVTLHAVVDSAMVPSSLAAILLMEKSMQVDCMIRSLLSCCFWVCCFSPPPRILILKQASGF